MTQKSICTHSYMTSGIPSELSRMTMGVPWFVAVDIGKALEYGKHTLQAVRKYVRDYHKQSLVIPAIYPKKKILLVHPNGVDNLCAYCNSEKADEFQRWIWYGLIRGCFTDWYNMGDCDESIDCSYTVSSETYQPAENQNLLERNWFSNKQYPVES